MSFRFLDAFLGGLGNTPEFSDRERQAVGECLDAIIEEARAAAPGVSLDGDQFCAFLAEKIEQRDDAEEISAEWLLSCLAEMRGTDLYLALACSLGDERAIREFERRYFVVIPGALARMRECSATVDEVAQILRERFFVAPVGQRARVAELAGNGDLGALVRVAAVRTALNLKRRDRRLEPDSEAIILERLAPDANPEMQALKEHHRADVLSAFESAIGELDHRERTLLRLHLIHELTIDEIGGLFEVHRATAARWLVKVREKLNRTTMRILRQRLGVDRDEFESLIRLVQSRLDVSFERLLATGSDDGE